MYGRVLEGGDEEGAEVLAVLQRAAPVLHNEVRGVLDVRPARKEVSAVGDRRVSAIWRTLIVLLSEPKGCNSQQRLYPFLVKVSARSRCVAATAGKIQRLNFS